MSAPLEIGLDISIYGGLATEGAVLVGRISSAAVWVSEKDAKKTGKQSKGDNKKTKEEGKESKEGKHDKTKEGKEGKRDKIKESKEGKTGKTGGEDGTGLPELLPGVFNPFAEARAEPTNAAAAPEAKIDKPTVTQYHINVFPQDSLWELRQRIAAATGISPYRQHLRVYVADGERSEQLGYTLQVMGLPYAVASPSAGTTMIGHFPVDERLVSNTEDLRVLVDEDVPLQELLGGLIGAEVGVRLELWDLDPWLHDLPTDDYQRRTLYQGFIVKYWPMLSGAAFEALLTDRGGLAEQYPLLCQPGPVTQQDERLRLANAARTSPHSLSVKRAVLGMLGAVELDLEHLFRELGTSPEVPVLLLARQNGTRHVRLYRAPEQASEALFAQLEPQLTRRDVPHLVAVLMTGGDVGALVFLNQQRYWVEVEGRRTRLDDLQREVGAVVNPFLREVNALGRLVFFGRERLPEVVQYSPVEQLELTLLWGISGAGMGTAQFNRLWDLLKQDAEVGLVTLTKERRSTVTDRVECLYRKGVLYPPLRLDAANQYDYLTTSMRGEYLAQRVGLTTEFQLHMTDIAVSCKAIREETLPFWVAYVLGALTRLRALAETREKTPAADELDRGNLRLLKQRDPELYLPKTRDHVVYSRVCQKSHQPVAYTEEELEDLSPAMRSRAVRYWNFTTSQPLWYVCPGARYPHLGFITGRHPQGFCYPCCKKTPVSAVDGNVAHQSCLKEHSFTESTGTTHDRYIYNYGKELAQGRLGHLPPELGRYLQFSRTVAAWTNQPPRHRGRPPHSDTSDAVPRNGARRGYFLLGVVQTYGGVEHFGLPEALAAVLGDTEETLARLRWTPSGVELLFADGAELEDAAMALLARVPTLGFQVFLLTANTGTFDLLRLGDPQRPAIVLFRRVLESTPFGKVCEWYPVVEVDELAFFRERTILNSTFSAESDLARLLRDLAGVDLRTPGVTPVAAVGEPPFAAIVTLENGHQTVVPPSAPGELLGLPVRPHPTLAQITCTAEEVQKMLAQRGLPVEALLVTAFRGRNGGEDDREGGGKEGRKEDGSKEGGKDGRKGGGGGVAVGVRTAAGCVWFRGQSRASVEWKVPVEELHYPPDELYRGAAKNPTQPKTKRSTAQVREEYHDMLRALLEHLDGERDETLRGHLRQLALGSNRSAAWLDKLVPGDRQEIERIMGLGLPPDATAYRLAQGTYQTDQRTLHALLEVADDRPRLRVELGAVLRRLGYRPGREMLDLLLEEFSDPIRRRYLRGGYHPTFPVRAAPWEDVYAL